MPQESFDKYLTMSDDELLAELARQLEETEHRSLGSSTLECISKARVWVTGLIKSHRAEICRNTALRRSVEADLDGAHLIAIVISAIQPLRLPVEAGVVAALVLRLGIKHICKPCWAQP